MSDTIAITGSSGVVGRALTDRLASNYEVVPIDLPNVDVNHSDQLHRALHGAAVVIHLAGVFTKENWRTPDRDLRNMHLFNSALMGSLLAEARQFIFASSIHAENTIDFMRSQKPGELLVARYGEFATEVASGYGQSKRQQEDIAQKVSGSFDNGVVAIRLGAVKPNDLPICADPNPIVAEHERRVWLAHDDLANLVQAAIANYSPDFTPVYAVSDNDDRFHALANPFGWFPHANSAAVLLDMY